MIRTLLLISVCFVLGCFPTEGPIPFGNPSENYLNVSGNIKDGIKYKVSVEYVSISNNNSCKNYNLLADLHVSKSKKFDYLPVIDAHRHNIHIPLKALSSETECNWRPTTVYICAGPSEEDSPPPGCFSLFFIDTKKYDGNKVIDIECRESGLCRTGHPTENVAILNQEYVVNLSMKKQNK